MLEKEFQEKPPAIQAQTLAWRAIARAQGKREIPRWFLPNQTTRARCREDGIWEVSVELFRSRPGDGWETMEDGSRMQVSFDPRSGKKGWTIHRGEEKDERVEIFRGHSDLTTGATSVVKETCLDELNPEDFSRHYSDAYPLPIQWQLVVPNIFGADGG